MNIQFNNTILLLGAGFSANFGGWLAKQMWTKLFNNPLLNDSKEVKQELLKQFDFENIYSELFNDRIKKVEQFTLFEQILQEAYIEMNGRLMYPEWSKVDVNPDEVRGFINNFVNDGSGNFGAIFSLNQDLFFEKTFQRQPLGPKTMQYDGTPGNINENDFRTNKLLPELPELEEYKKEFEKERFGFIKLHGSLNWLTGEGKSAKVIGLNKPEIIKTIPLLDWYNNTLFKTAINQQNIKLVVYGYSFNDTHINDSLYDAIHGNDDKKGNNMKIYIISTEDPENFYERLYKKDPVKFPEIWQAVDGYFPYYMKDLFPGNATKTLLRKEVYTKIGFNFL